MTNVVNTAIKGAIVVTPSDTIDITYPANALPRSIQCNVAGNVTLVLVGSSTPIPLTLLAGVMYPYAVKRVNSTGTDSGLGITVGYS